MSDDITISIKKENIWKYSTLLLLGVLVVGAFVFLVNGNPTGNTVNVNENGQEKISASEDDDAVLGDENAPVTIVEFSDYQCPFCSRFWSETLPFIKENYIDTGKVKLVYRDFPLTNIHPMALPAAEAAECVREQGGDSAYFEMHDIIFANQRSLSESNLKIWADELGYDIDSCLSSGKFRDEVQNDLNDGSSAGVRGTPSFFVNGKAVSGAQPYSVFEQIIESELKG